jgi:hypothetical protein
VRDAADKLKETKTEHDEERLECHKDVA